ncbi:MAG TPA: SPFH domain-containing protein [Planctomycetota bacterium]|nr:SPFH domain-containing protein [Planctomycetota bacterium]
MAAFMGIVIGLALIGAGIGFSEKIGFFSSLLLVAAGAVIVLITAILTAITKLYRKTTANEAFVRTGMGKAKVVLDGGAFVVPMIHRVVPVSLETMRLNVTRNGAAALITGDNLRVDIAAEFYIKVQPEANDILNAARSLGEKSVSEDSISDLVMEKLISALRTVAATRPLIELHTKRDEFASAVQQIVTQDLQENGLTLESVTISSLDQTALENLKDDNIFDAQGKRRITEITQDQMVKRNEITRNAERDIRTKDVMTRKQILDLDKDRDVAEATQGRDVANVQAERKRETNEFAIQQEREVELARVQKDLTVQNAEITRDRDLSVAQAKREEAERLAQIERDKAQQEADVVRTRAVEVAKRQAEVAVAEQETKRAQTQAQTRAAEAKREEETQRIETVKVTFDADRRAQQKMITEKQQVDIKKYQDQVAAEVTAYTTVKVADGELTASDKRKQAMLILAEGQSESAKKIAEGERAKEMVPVQVDREKVNVEAARVEVRRQDLENQEKYSEAALDFELKKQQIVANKEVQVQMANAVGTMLASAKMQIFGDPSTLANLYGQFLKSVGWGLTVQGLVESTPEPVRDAALKLVGGTGQVLRDVVARVVGKQVDVDPKALEQALVEAIAKAKEKAEEAPPEAPAK